MDDTVARDDDKARRPSIETADDGGWIRQFLSENVEQRALRILVRRMDDHASRFVHDDQMIVAVEYPHFVVKDAAGHASDRSSIDHAFRLADRSLDRTW